MKPVELSRFLFILVIVPNLVHSMIITSVYGGRKKFKTISFDFLPFLPPLAYAKPHKLQMAYRGHYTIKPPNFKFNVNLPLSLPITPFNGRYLASPHSYPNGNDHYDNYEALPSNQEDSEQVEGEQEEDPNNNGGEEEAEEEPSQSEPQLDTMSNYPAYIRNGGHSQNQDFMTADGSRAGTNAGRPAAGDNPRPYTGKAQVSSFIDNGQFVTATKDNMAGMDAAFSDQTDTQRQPQDIRRTKTIPLGYNTRNRQPNQPPSYVESVAAHPDSMPFGLDYQALQKYYTTFQFTDSLQGSYQPYKRKGLFGFNKLFPTLG